MEKTTTGAINIDDITDVGSVEPTNAVQTSVPTVEGSEPVVVGKPASAFAKRTDDLVDNDKPKTPAVPQTQEEIDAAAAADVDVDVDDTDETAKSDLAEFYSGIATILRDKAILDIPEDSVIEDEQGLLTVMEENITSRLDERSKQIETYMKAGVPFAQVSKIESALNKANQITDEVLRTDTALARELIISEFKERGFSETQSARYYEMIEKEGVDNVVTEATNSLALRKSNLTKMLSTEVETATAKRDNEQKTAEELAEKVGESIKNGEIFGRKLAPATQTKLVNMANNVVGKDENGEPVNALMKFKSENPVDFEHKLLYLFTVTDGFKDLKAFDRSAESRVSTKMKNAVSVISSGKSFTDNNTSSTPGKTKLDMDSIDDIV